MRAELERAARSWWAGGGGAAGRLLAAAALPAELLFRGAVSLRGAAYDAGLARTARAPVPVISVGNLTVGGTGKTPLVGWVVQELVAAGRCPAVALRGYGHDEILLHRRWHPGVPVHAHPDRVRAARAARAAGADTVVLDDGFQHRRLERDLDLVVVAVEQPFPGALLPRGPYREPVGALVRADWVIVTRRTVARSDAERLEDAVRRVAPQAGLARVRLAPAGWRRLDGERVDPPAGDVLAVAGVGEPRSFASLVERATGVRVERLDFTDHHDYSPRDLELVRRAARGRTVVTTEKDAVKLQPHAALLPDARVLLLKVEVESGEASLRAAVVGAASGPRSWR